MNAEDAAVLARLAAWLLKVFRKLPKGGALTVTLRKDRGGHLHREFHVNEGRILTAEELEEQT